MPPITRFLLLLVLIPRAAIARPGGARSDIAGVYARVALAAQNKFVDGMLSVQSARFRAFGPSGQLVDLSQQRARYRELLASAVVVSLTTEIEDYREQLPRATCQVHQCLRWEQVDGRTNKLIIRVLESQVTDHWFRGRAGWKLEASQVTFQRLETQEADGQSARVKPPRGQR